MPDIRTRTPWDVWYSRKRWRRRSDAQLREHPLCAMCLKEGKVVPASVADHVIPHHGDPNLFWQGELQSLCTMHHSSSKRFEELRGYTRDIGVDGWPVDPRHPANK